VRSLTFTRGLALKLFAVALAVALRFVVAGDPTVERGLRVPLEFENLPGSVEIMGGPPEAVEVRVRGPSGVLRRLEAGDVAAIIDLGSGRLGDRLFDMMEGGVRAPFGVEVAQVIPSTVSLRLEVEPPPRLVPIVPVTEGEPAAGFVVGGVTVEPAMVEVVGPLSQFLESTEVITESIDLAGTAVPVNETVAVGVADSRLRLLAPVKARVTVDIVREPVQRTLEDIPVRVRNVSEGLSGAVAPAFVTVTVFGPPEVMRELAPETVGAYVDLAGHVAGVYNLAVEVDARRLFDVTGIDPSVAQVTLR